MSMPSIVAGRLRAFIALPVTAGLLAVALATGAAVPQSIAEAATASDAPVTRTYAASTLDIANPDRGMYRYSETRLLADGSGYAPLDLARTQALRTRENVTLIYRIFYLEKYRTVDSMTSTDLALVAADFGTARAAGVKLIVRFAYSSSSSADAPAHRTVGHIRQLAPVLNANSDVIMSLQAGFIGQWGEWYYTDNYASTPTTPWVLSEADWAARGSVLNALLEATDSALVVQVRYPSIKQRLVPVTHPAATRVGIHNDCFLAGTDDYGTFPKPTDRAWLAVESRTTLMGGESCTTNAPRSLWPSAAEELAAYHWTYLNADFDTNVLDSWGADGRAEARRRLGHRLRLVQATLPSASRAGSPLSLELSLRNDGFAAPLSRRPVMLVMRSDTATYQVPLPMDLRTVAPGETFHLPLTVPAPPVVGEYALFLAMPDPAPKLAEQPAYAIQLANAGLWHAGRGWNDLQHTVQVLSPLTAAPPTSTASPTASPTMSPAPTSPVVSSTALSGLSATDVRNGWGPIEKDRSNGEAAAGDGRALSLRGRGFSTGLGVHSASSMSYALNGRYSSFRATVGVDDETVGRGAWCSRCTSTERCVGPVRW
jgi:hypothetical protein